MARVASPRAPAGGGADRDLLGIDISSAGTALATGLTLSRYLLMSARAIQGTPSMVIVREPMNATLLGFRARSGSDGAIPPKSILPCHAVFYGYQHGHVRRSGPETGVC